MSQTLWSQWQEDWRWMEGVARKRGWELTPLAISPPAPEGEIRRVETESGLRFPSQLREALTCYSARVAFGWRVPAHLRAPEGLNMPTCSANRGALWDLAHIENAAIPNFLEWKKYCAEHDRQGRWENQFPFYELMNGDLLALDLSNPAGPHPVRYFSHEMEMLHGLALAPDFFTFVTEMSRLGFAGSEGASWFCFGEEEGDAYFLKADSAGGKRWRAWLEQDPNAPDADAPPPVVLESTAADRALLLAAKANDTAGVMAALAVGAQVDAVWDMERCPESVYWNEEFATALIYAARHDNIPLMASLLQRGATLNTRRLPLADALETAPLATVQWLVDKGARVNGWRGTRFWPLHILIMNRAAASSKADYEAYLRQQRWDEAYIQQKLAICLDPDSHRAMLEMLLAAGADPDARWEDGDYTMLMRCDAETAVILARHGADIHARDRFANTVLHHAHSPKKVRFLAQQGADLNAAGEKGKTPLQHALSLARYKDGALAVAKTLLEQGADATQRDADGKNALCYCATIEGFKLIQEEGLDPLERLPDGGTLLHNLFRQHNGARASEANEVAFLDFLLGLGLDINATDHAGQTILHLAAQKGWLSAADIRLMLQRGADPSIRDGAGKRPRDVAPRRSFLFSVLKRVVDLLR
jgi:ankyrin repeat protein